MSEVYGRLSAEKNKLLIIIGIVVLGLAAAVGGFFAWQYFTDTDRINRETASRVLGEVGAIYELPSEKPTIAQMQNPASLQGQEFYQKAQKGDYVLIYPDSKLAIIYRASTKKLINVDHVELNKP